MTREPPQETTCLHCGQPIRLFYTYQGANGEWMHTDGRHAFVECRGLKATPKEEEEVETSERHHRSETP